MDSCILGVGSFDYRKSKKLRNFNKLRSRQVQVTLAARARFCERSIHMYTHTYSHLRLHDRRVKLNNEERVEALNAPRSKEEEKGKVLPA